MKLPDNQLNIIVPVLKNGVFYQKKLKGWAETIYRPEFSEEALHEWEKQKKRNTDISLHPVTYKTPIAIREATEILAYYFRREFKYDFLGYDASEDAHRQDRVFLLTQDDGWHEQYAIGAVVFRWRKYREMPEQRVLAWVWIHPFLRWHGILSDYWEFFKKLYGNFIVEPPLSPAMHAFLEKQGYKSPFFKKEE